MRFLGRTRAPAQERAPRPVLDAAGLRSRDVLAFGRQASLWLLAGRDHLSLVAYAGGTEEPTETAEPATPAELMRRTSWVDLDLADWDADESRLTLVPSQSDEESWTVDLDDAGDLLAVVRERLSATLVLERHARLGDHQITAVCRRRPEDGSLLWRLRYSAGLDADDPDVRRAASRLLLAAQEETGHAG